jgi:hypothetical protein
MTILLCCAVLCCLQPQFNFSSASHSLLSVFRALSGTHGQAIAARSKDAVAQQVAILLPMAQAVGPVCVTTMPVEQRDKYIKQVLVVQGLVALTSAVARNVTAMLPQVGIVGLTALGHTDSSVQQGYIRSRQHDAGRGWNKKWWEYASIKLGSFCAGWFPVWSTHWHSLDPVPVSVLCRLVWAPRLCWPAWASWSAWSWSRSLQQTPGSRPAT